MNDNKELSEAVRAAQGFESSLADIELQLELLTAEQVVLKDVTNQVSHIDNAKLYAGIAYTLDSLFYMYLKTQGINATTHGVKKELDRVKKYIAKVAEASKKPEANPSRIDRGAAGRFIRAALADGKSSADDNTNTSTNDTSISSAAPGAMRPPNIGSGRAKPIPNFPLPAAPSLRHPNPSATSSSSSSPASSPPPSPQPTSKTSMSTSSSPSRRPSTSGGNTRNGNNGKGRKK